MDFLKFVRVQTFSIYNQVAVEAYKQELIRITTPPANLLLEHFLKSNQQKANNKLSSSSSNSNSISNIKSSSNSNNGIDNKLLSLKQKMKTTNSISSNNLNSNKNNKVIEFQLDTTSSPTTTTNNNNNIPQIISPFDNATQKQQAQQQQLPTNQPIIKLATCETTKDFTLENIDKVLDEIRPMLIADGGNVAIVNIDKTTRNIKLLLQGRFR